MTPEKPQNSKENSSKGEWLKPYHFKPGQSGNPGGRPKTTPITDMLRRIFEQDAELAEEELRNVLKGKSAVAKVMLLEKAADRLEGKVTQPVEVEIVGLAERLKRARERRGR